MTEADLPPVDPDHESRPPPRPGTVAELEELLGQHREWLESKGQTGERASLPRALLQDAYLQGTDFSQAMSSHSMGRPKSDPHRATASAGASDASLPSSFWKTGSAV